MPAILREETNVFVTGIKGVELALVVLAGNADKEIGKVHACLRSGENEVAIELSNGRGIDLIGVELTAKFHGVVAVYLGEGISNLIRVVDLNQLVGCSAGGITVEIEVLNALPLGIERNNAGRAVGILEALRSQAYAKTADRLSKIGEVAHIAQV